MTNVANKHKYSVMRFRNALLAPIFTVVSLLVKKEEYFVITALFNTEFSDNSRSIFEQLYSSKEYKGKVYYVLNDKKKREALNRRYPGCFISNGAYRDIKKIIKAKYWITSSLDCPLPGYFNKYTRTVWFFGHGLPLKKAGLAGNNVSWYKKLYYRLMVTNISTIFSTSKYFIPKLAEVYGFKPHDIDLLPAPKAALLAKQKNIEQLPSLLADRNKTHVLYAPTWRPYGSVEFFPFDDQGIAAIQTFLEKNNIHVWLRVHPRFEQELPNELLCASNIGLFGSAQCEDINCCLRCFDALITDYSSIYFDFLLLHRPVLFFDYDKRKYDKHVGLFDDYEDTKSAPSTRSAEQFFSQLMEIKNNTFDVTKVVMADEIINYPMPVEKVGEAIIKRLLSEACFSQ